MTLPSGHRIWNSSSGGLRPSSLPLAHRGSPLCWIFTSEGGGILFVCLKLECHSVGWYPFQLAGSGVTIRKLGELSICLKQNWHWHFQQQISPTQKRRDFLWMDIFKTWPGLIRAIIRISNISHATSHTQLICSNVIKKLWTFSVLEWRSRCGNKIVVCVVYNVYKIAWCGLQKCLCVYHHHSQFHVI